MDPREELLLLPQLLLDIVGGCSQSPGLELVDDERPRRKSRSAASGNGAFHKNGAFHESGAFHENGAFSEKPLLGQHSTGTDLMTLIDYSTSD